jgi:3-hydroxyisobutyrate dehydrogenase-like beta-hydroxyacid dehydrogenase
VTESETPTRVTVAGTGTMGSALARALLAAAHDVTVWNRTRSRAAALEPAGARVADTLADAVAQSEVTVMCVANQTVSQDLLDSESVHEALRGRTLFQLTTGTQADGRRNARWADDHGVAYLDGAIMAYPRTIGTADATILYAGAEAVFARNEKLLRALGQALYVGEDAGRPAVIDAALIAFFYGTLAGFLHGAVLAGAEGIGIDELVRLSDPFFSSFIAPAVAETGERISAHRYGEAQSSMDTHFGGIDLLVRGASEEAGIDTEVITAIRNQFARALEAGRGQDDIAVLYEVALNRSPVTKS